MDLQPILQSWGQFFFTNIDLSKLLNYKQRLLKLVRIPTKEKIISVFIWNQ
jgi:hypothetical protein